MRNSAGSCRLLCIHESRATSFNVNACRGEGRLIRKASAESSVSGMRVQNLVVPPFAIGNMASGSASARNLGSLTARAPGNSPECDFFAFAGIPDFIAEEAV
jgi:hypothetical protein